MAREQFATAYLSWLRHIIPLLLATGLFLPAFFMGRFYLYLALVMIIFACSAVLDKRLKMGAIVGAITVVILSVINLKLWQLHTLITTAPSTPGTEPLLMFAEPLHPALFFLLLLVAVFLPYLVVWLSRRKGRLDPRSTEPLRPS